MLSHHTFATKQHSNEYPKCQIIKTLTSKEERAAGIEAMLWLTGDHVVIRKDSFFKQTQAVLCCKLKPASMTLTKERTLNWTELNCVKLFKTKMLLLGLHVYLIYKSSHTKNKALHLYTFHQDSPVDYNRAFVVFRGTDNCCYPSEESVNHCESQAEEYWNNSKVLKPNSTWPQLSSFVCHVFLPAVTRNWPGKPSFLTPFCDEPSDMLLFSHLGLQSLLIGPQKRNGLSWKCATLANHLS